MSVAEAYRVDFDRLKHPRRGHPKPLKIYMSSSTDPYVPQEKSLGLTAQILNELLARPPDVLVIQTHSSLIERGIDLIEQLASRCDIWVSITVETDRESIAGFRPHASSPARRVESFGRFHSRGIPTQATISPLLPIANPETFAHGLDRSRDRVILDHYLIGDGSPGGWRTRKTGLAQVLEKAGFAEWNQIDKLHEVRELMTQILGEDRVLVGQSGFNAVGRQRTTPVSPA